MKDPLWYSFIAAVVLICIIAYKRERKIRIDGAFIEAYLPILIIATVAFRTVVFPRLASKVYPIESVNHAFAPSTFDAIYLVEIKLKNGVMKHRKGHIHIERDYSDCSIELRKLEIDGRGYRPDEYEHKCLYDVGVEVDDIVLGGLRYEYLKLLDIKL